MTLSLQAVGLTLSLAEHLVARQGIGNSGPDCRSVGVQVKANHPSSWQGSHHFEGYPEMVTAGALSQRGIANSGVARPSGFLGKARR